MLLNKSARRPAPLIAEIGFDHSQTYSAQTSQGNAPCSGISGVVLLPQNKDTKEKQKFYDQQKPRGK
jgi:hypothetical protein